MFRGGKSERPEELVHQGFVNDDEIWEQPNARKVVRQAVRRACLGLPSEIRWFSENFDHFCDPDDFCARIRHGVFATIDDQDFDTDDFIVIVEYIKRNLFMVTITKEPDFEVVN